MFKFITVIFVFTSFLCSAQTYFNPQKENLERYQNSECYEELGFFVNETMKLFTNPVKKQK